MMNYTVMTARVALIALCLRGIERVAAGECKGVAVARQHAIPSLSGWRPLKRRQWERVVGLIRIGGLAIEDLPDALEMAGLGWIADRLRLPGLVGTALMLLEERRACTALCDQYPARWQHKLGEAAPGAVWWNGVDWRAAGFECDIPNRPHAPVIAVVGSRGPEQVTATMAASIGVVIARLGFAFCSGGAAGVDTVAADGFCEGGVACDQSDNVGAKFGGIIVTPLYGWRRDQRHDGVACVSSDSAVAIAHSDASDCTLAEFSCNPPWAAFSTAAAMERNQLIYALADAAVILQPRYRQGGTWHGAITAHRMRLCQLIVPENPACLATRALVALGATPLMWDTGNAAGNAAGTEVGSTHALASGAKDAYDVATNRDALAVALRHCIMARKTGTVTQRALGL